MAAFAPLADEDVSIIVISEGAGRVTMSPRGNRFPRNRLVRLVAVPEPNQTFLGWNGNPSSEGILELTLADSAYLTSKFTDRPLLEAMVCGAIGGSRGLRLELLGWSYEGYVIEGSKELAGPWSVLRVITRTSTRIQFDLDPAHPRRDFRAAESP